MNQFVTCLPGPDGERLMEQCEHVELEFGRTLCEANERLEHVYFPCTGVISLVASVEQYAPLEMGLIGDEGMLGATLALGVETSPLRAMVQGNGIAMRMDAATFKEEMAISRPLRALVRRYLYVLIEQLSQSVVCTRFHSLEARLARWLLMTDDRAHGEHFHLTHAFLAGMLGVRRSGITVAAGALQQRKLIGYSRGEIRILDRKGLEAVSCECYHLVEAAYKRHLG